MIAINQHHQHCYKTTYVIDISDITSSLPLSHNHSACSSQKVQLYFASNSWQNPVTGISEQIYSNSNEIQFSQNFILIETQKEMSFKYQGFNKK